MSIDHFTFEDGRARGLPEAQVESFLKHLRAAGYAEGTLRKKRPIVASFARWTRHKQVAVGKLDESYIAAFVDRPPRKRKARVRLELAVLRLFLDYLRLEARVPTPSSRIDSSPAAKLHRCYVNYLRNERGLAENSICVYSRYIHDFLTTLMDRSGSVSPERVDALTVQEYLLARVRDRSSEWSKLLATALRSFFRFLHVRGETAIDLSLSVPTVRSWCQASVPTLLSLEEVETVLSATDRSTPRGRRDYAILLLLARLGLRAGEVVFLELGDLRWRTGEIVVRGKGRILDRLPLLSEIGEALALYLQKDRLSCNSQRVFLRMLAPRVGLTGPAAVGHVVRAALARAGIRRTSRGAAHIFRHSLASRMIRHGASIAEISEVLRHHSQSTTEVYAKVDFEALRSVARPWPATGGAR
jgi:site-specific recombinase XerD